MAEQLLAPRMSKKEQIAALYQLGITGVDELAMLTQSRPSYVANVLQEAEVMQGYFDLYTSTERPMNVYSKYFAGRLGFKDRGAAAASVHYLDTLYRQWQRIGDRAGQHHALMLALTMRNRALWSGKTREAKIFGAWLGERLEEADEGSGALSSPSLAEPARTRTKKRQRQK